MRGNSWSLAIAALLSGCAGPLATREVAGPVTVGIVAINDFHGNLEPPKASVAAPGEDGATISVPAGGAAWLGSAVKQVRGKYAHHVTVAAGDLIGASPLASSYYLDEPTIGALDRMGLEIAAVGNHEFDRGRAELLRMQNGGCAKHTRREPCRLERFKGARFRYLAASTRTQTGDTLFPATFIRQFGKGRRRVSVGFIGLSLKGTPLLVTPEGIAGLTFGDEAEAINAEVPRLKARGADAIVVLIHEGGATLDPPDPDRCDGLSGAIVPILEKLDPRVDVVVSGHTHRAYVCEAPSRDPAHRLLVTSAGHYGRLVTDIALDIDPAANRVIARRADNVIVQSQAYATARETAPNTDEYPRFSPDPAIAAYVDRYVRAASVIAGRPAGRIAGPAQRGPVNSGGALGNLIADAQLAATAAAGAQIAFTNPFGIRAPLSPAPDGSLTYGDLYAVQPFDNPLVTQTMTGAEIAEALEQCFDAIQPEQVLTPSAGFTYSFDRRRPVGQRIVAMALNGVPIDPAASYRVTTNAFLMFGGDGFSAFTRRRAVTTGMGDLDALEAWLQSDPPRSAPVEERAVELR